VPRHHARDAAVRGQLLQQLERLRGGGVQARALPGLEALEGVRPGGRRGRAGGRRLPALLPLQLVVEARHAGEVSGAAHRLHLARDGGQHLQLAAAADARPGQGVAQAQGLALVQEFYGGQVHVRGVALLHQARQLLEGGVLGERHPPCLPGIENHDLNLHCEAPRQARRGRRSELGCRSRFKNVDLIWGG
jgi:hypothetical protein